LRLILHQESRNPSVAVRNRQRAGLESACCTDLSVAWRSLAYR
jgi:hypothetical protein